MGHLSLEEAAKILGVSVAAVRNWIRLGRLRTGGKHGRRMSLDTYEVLLLKERISSGSLPLLCSRRNKTANGHYFLPKGYLAQEISPDILRQIVDLVRGINREDVQELVLAEVFLILLAAQGKITPDVHAPSSLLEMVCSGKLALGKYRSYIESILGSSDFPPEAFAHLTTLSTLNLPFVLGNDLLGLVYLATQPVGNRKVTGSYYTPWDVVNSLVEQSLRYADGPFPPEVVDPCCGSGNFLLKLFLSLKEKLVSQGIDGRTAEAMIIPKLVGLDIDPIAVTLTKMNLLLAMEYPPAADIFRISCGDGLEVTMSNVEMILGNPPWGSQPFPNSREDASEKTSLKRGARDSFDLFLEKGLAMLRPGGVLGFVLPESLLTVKRHTNCRRTLVETTTIRQIRLLGTRFTRVTAPAIGLITTKRPAFGSHRITVFSPKGTAQVPQAYFQNQNDYVFAVNCSAEDRCILETMVQVPSAQFLKGQAQFALGIVTGDNEHALSLNPTPGSEIILRGKDVFRFSYRPSKTYLKFEPEKFQQVAPTELYRSSEKLIYRFINRQLVFAYDNQQMLTLNSANIVIPKLANIPIKYVLAVLNSRAAQFWHMTNFDTVKVLRQHIESIPIPIPSPDAVAKVVYLVDKLLLSSGTEERIALYEVIDEVISQLYGLDSEEQQYVRQRVDPIKYLA